MDLNVKTLIIIVGLVFLIRFLFLFYLYATNKSYKGLGWFVLWSSSDIIILLTIILRNTLTVGEIFLIPQNIMQLLSLIFIYTGLMKFINAKVNNRQIILYSGLFVLLVSYFAYINNIPSVRIGIINIFIGILLIYTAIRFKANMPAFLKKLGIIVISGMVFHSFFLFFIAALNFFIYKENSLFSQNPVNTAQFFGMFSGSVFWMFLIIMMINQRLNNDLLDSMEHFRSVFLSNPDATIISKISTGLIVDVNENMCKLFGFKKEEVIGKTSLDLDIWERNESRSEIMEKLKEKKELNNLEIRLKRKDRKLITGLLSIKILEVRGEVYMLGVMRDITKRKEEEEKYKLLAENMTDIIWSAEADTLEFRYVSPSVERMLGYSVKETMTMTLKSLLESEEMGSFIQKILLHANKLKNGEERFDKFFINEIEQKRKDGAKIWTEVITNCYLNENTGKIEIHGVTRDISERKKVEIEKNMAYAELQKTNAEKDKFFSIIAHDLRSPFNGILGITKMMASDLSQFSVEEIQDISKNINKSASNLYRLLNNLLEWARVQRGMTEFTPEYFQVNEVINDSITLFSETANQKRIKITDSTKENVFINADKFMIETIVRNFVSNSIKFTKEGGEVVISCEKKAKTVEISVMDNGIGMSRVLLENLFKIDKQTSRNGTNNEPGTALGLILCDEFAKKHNGEIVVESEEGKGSRFTLVMPV